MERKVEAPPWMILDKGVRKDWLDLTPEELVEAVNNSDNRTFGEEGVDAHRILSIIQKREDLTEQIKKDLTNQVREKSTQRKTRIKPTSVEWLKD